MAKTVDFEIGSFKKKKLFIFFSPLILKAFQPKIFRHFFRHSWKYDAMVGTS